MRFNSMRRIAAVAALVTAVGLFTTVAAAGATGVSQSQRRGSAARDPRRRSADHRG
jgi:hypothetical protein